MAYFNAVRSSDYQDVIQGKKVWDLLVADDCSRIEEKTVPTLTLNMLDASSRGLKIILVEVI